MWWGNTMGDVCVDRLANFIDIPKVAKRLIVTITKGEPAKTGNALRLTENKRPGSWDPHGPWLHVDGKYAGDLSNSLIGAIEVNVGLPCWATVEYS
jgi:hypothetical protein